uniref:Torsin n=2 Tax=Meloidogyne TaxID=189290 RepID=A0A914L921_MELIC
MSRRSKALFLILFLYTAQLIFVFGEVVTLAVGAGAVSALGMFIGDFAGIYSFAKCKFFECCNSPWINKDVARRLQEEVEERLYGQHIAQKIVINAVRAHISKQNPNKALVLSFHGWTGSGKNYLTQMIAKAVYKKGFKSQFVHFSVATLHFPYPEEINNYKRQLRSWISGNLTQCERSLFIFDEADKLPLQLLDAIVPFVDFYDNVNGIDARKSIFIFLSNGGSNLIAQHALEYYKRGLPREQMTFKELEELMQLSAYNEGEGGLKMSRIISKHLIDYFVPFLPLERRHIIMCFRDYLHSKNIVYTQEQLENLADQLSYFPKDTPIFSTSGCKQIERRADFMYAEVIREQHFLASQYNDEI